jgi:ribokinase
VEALLRKARQSGATTILDPAPARALSPELLGLVDYLTPNQTEAALLLGDAGEPLRDPAAAGETAERLRRLGPRGIVVKLGAGGCFLLAGGVREHVPGFPVDAVDATAAGDVFNGAFAAALAEGRDACEAASFANAAAAISVTRHGAQSSIPDRGEVARFLNQAAAAGGFHVYRR